MEANQNSDASAIIQATMDNSAHAMIPYDGDDAGGIPAYSLVVIPKGRSIESMKKFDDERRTRPIRRTGSAVMASLGSFIAHVNRHKDANSVVFADVLTAAPSLVAVLDYQEAGPIGSPRFGSHRTVYNFPLSEEWQAWKRVSDNAAAGKYLSLTDFAEFVEARLIDIMEPAAASERDNQRASALGITLATPAKMLLLSRGLAVRVDSKIAGFKNLASGEASLMFDETHTDEKGAPLAVPGGFIVAIPVFKNGPLYKIAVRLRYRVAGGAVHWNLAMHRPDLALEDAIKDARETVAKDTGLLVLEGRPE